jgi:DNA-binding transcriptional MerR regulator
MKDYLSIGKVSKLKGVSIKSLRYYDEIGILKPAYVNQETNYRYYSPKQLFLIDAILLCIELGIPLKTLPSYQDKDGNWDFQRLLFDGKALAEDKIRSMRNSIDALQSTLRRIEAGELDPHCNEISPLPPDTCKQHFPDRFILAVPFDIATTIEHYNHKLLELFVGANKIGINATYPAGLYYEQINQVLSRYVFVHLESDSVAIASDSDFIIRKLPAGDYLCTRKHVHQIEQASSLFENYFEENADYQLLEQTVTKDNTKQALFELQLFMKQ